VAVSTIILRAGDILLGLFRNEALFGHDLLTGLLVVRTS
jgi:hypothetical protein